MLVDAIVQVFNTPRWSGAPWPPYNRYMHETTPLLQRVLFWLFIAWVVWLPLPIGSNRPLWVGIALAAGMAILALWLCGWIAGHLSAPRAVRRSRWPLAVMVLFLAWQLGQMYLPGALASEWVQNAYQQAGVQSHSLTADASESAAALRHSVLAATAFLLTLLLVPGLRDLHRLLWTLVWVGVVMAVVAGITVMEGADVRILGVAMSSGSVASGSFINRNHFANYLVLALSAGIGLLISMQTRSHGGHWRARLRGWAATLLGPKARLRVFLGLMVVSLVLTRSRMGNTSFFLSLLVAGALALVLIRGRSRPLMLLIASLVAIDIFIVGTWFGVEQVVDRIQNTVTVTEEAVIINEKGRMEANREALEIISQAPVTGMGGGTWFIAFTSWRAWDHGFFDHAHNDYLEFAVEFGIPATLLLGVFVLLSLRRCLKQLASRRHPLVLGSAFACLMAIIAVATHALVEFNLHIPANAATFMILLALPWLHSQRSGGGRRQTLN